MFQALDLLFFARLGPYDKILLGPPCTLETLCACFVAGLANAKAALFGWTNIVYMYIYIYT